MTLDLEQLKDFRRTLHQYPEVSGQEEKTAQRVYELLQSCHPSQIQAKIGGNGIIATWDSGSEGPEVLFRAELDALPIQESNLFAHRSSNSGVSHKCGHDGHASILCGLAQQLGAEAPQRGKVHLLFQPAEENGDGAKAMLADPIFKKIKPDFVFALHNLPGYPLGQVVVKDDTFTASVNSIIISLEGKTAHAAEPEHGYNPATAIAQIITQSLALACNNAEREDMKVVTPVYIELGEKAYGISAGSASVHLTLRCWQDEYLRALENSIEQIARSVASQEHLNVSFEYTQTFHANRNDAKCIQFVRQAAEAAALSLEERPYPFKWGEDFGLFTSKYKGCMFGLGAGIDSPALHNPDYDFPDELIATGVQLFNNILNQIYFTK